MTQNHPHSPRNLSHYLLEQAMIVVVVVVDGKEVVDVGDEVTRQRQGSLSW